MNIHTLREKLNDIGLEEFMNFRVSEEQPYSPDAMKANREPVEAMLRELGSQLTPALLDELEANKSSIPWSLRLSPYVPGDDSKRRARRYIEHEDAKIHYRASVLLDRE